MDNINKGIIKHVKEFYIIQNSNYNIECVIFYYAQDKFDIINLKYEKWYSKESILNTLKYFHVFNILVSENTSHIITKVTKKKMFETLFCNNMQLDSFRYIKPKMGTFVNTNDGQYSQMCKFYKTINLAQKALIKQYKFNVSHSELKMLLMHLISNTKESIDSLDLIDKVLDTCCYITSLEIEIEQYEKDNLSDENILLDYKEMFNKINNNKIVKLEEYKHFDINLSECENYIKIDFKNCLYYHVSYFYRKFKKNGNTCKIVLPARH